MSERVALTGRSSCRWRVGPQSRILPPPFGGGVIGNTPGSGPVVEGSSPPPERRPRATLSAPSSSGLGRWPLKPVTPVRIRSGLPRASSTPRGEASSRPRPRHCAGTPRSPSLGWGRTAAPIRPPRSLSSTGEERREDLGGFAIGSRRWGCLANSARRSSPSASLPPGSTSSTTSRARTAEGDSTRERRLSTCAPACRWLFGMVTG